MSSSTPIRFDWNSVGEREARASLSSANAPSAHIFCLCASKKRARSPLATHNSIRPTINNKRVCYHTRRTNSGWQRAAISFQFDDRHKTFACAASHAMATCKVIVQHITGARHELALEPKAQVRVWWGMPLILSPDKARSLHTPDNQAGWMQGSNVHRSRCVLAPHRYCPLHTHPQKRATPCTPPPPWRSRARQTRLAWSCGARRSSAAPRPSSSRRAVSQRERDACV